MILLLAERLSRGQVSGSDEADLGLVHGHRFLFVDGPGLLTNHKCCRGQGAAARGLCSGAGASVGKPKTKEVPNAAAQKSRRGIGSPGEDRGSRESRGNEKEAAWKKGICCMSVLP